MEFIVFLRVSLIASSCLAMSLLVAGTADATNNSTHNQNHKVGICHATGSDTNPYVFINVDQHAAEAHSKHQDRRDVIGAKSLADCPKGSVAGASAPTPSPTPVPGKGGVALSTATTQPASLPKVGSGIGAVASIASALALVAGSISLYRKA